MRSSQQWRLVRQNWNSHYKINKIVLCFLSPFNFPFLCLYSGAAVLKQSREKAAGQLAEWTVEWFLFFTGSCSFPATLFSHYSSHSCRKKKKLYLSCSVRGSYSRCRNWSLSGSTSAELYMDIHRWSAGLSNPSHVLQCFQHLWTDVGSLITLV